MWLPTGYGRSLCCQQVMGGACAANRLWEEPVLPTGYGRSLCCQQVMGGACAANRLWEEPVLPTGMGGACATKSPFIFDYKLGLIGS